MMQCFQTNGHTGRAAKLAVENLSELWRHEEGSSLSTLLSAEPAPDSLLVLQDSVLAGVDRREMASPQAQTPQSLILKLKPNSSSWRACQDLPVLLVCSVRRTVAAA